MADQLQDLIQSFQESNKENKAHLHQVEAHTRNSRRHLLEMKKDVIVMSENIAKMANVEPPKSESEDTEQRREDAKRDDAQTNELKKIAAGIAGMKGGSGGSGGKGGKGLGGMLGLGGLGVAAMASAALKGAAGLVAMGVAIPAFFGGLIAGDAALSWMKDIGADFNFSSLKAAALGFSDMIMSMDIKAFTVLGAIMAVSAVGSTRAAKGLAFMGIGISAFLMGLLAGDAVISGMKSMGWIDMKFSGMKGALEGFSSMIMGLSTEAQVALGAMLVSSAVVGLVAKNPTSIGTAMAAMGAGISGFFIGLAVGDAALTWIGADYTGLTKALKGFDSAIGALTPESMIALGAILGVSMGIGALTDESTKVKMVTGVAAVTAGIGAFFLGFAGMDAAAKKLGEGDSVKKLMTNFAGAIGALDKQSMIALGGIMAIGGLFGAVPGGLAVATGAAIGMGLIGAGIAAFFLAFDGLAKVGSIIGVDGSSTKTLVTNMAAALKTLTTLDGDQLMKLGKALPGIGVGIGAFFAADALGSISESVKKGFNWLFGTKDQKDDKFQKMVDSLEPLKQIDAEAMSGLGKIIGDIERLGSVKISPSLGNNINLFAKGLLKAMEPLEKAIYGGVIEGPGFQKDVTIRGLANGGTEFELAVSNLKALQEASSSNVGAGGAPGAGAPQIINNYYGGQGNTSQTNIQGGVETTKKGGGAIVSEAEGWSNEYLNH
jgi:hypothetical protein